MVLRTAVWMNLQERRHDISILCTYCQDMIFTEKLATSIEDLWNRKFDASGYEHEYMRAASEIFDADKSGCPFCFYLVNTFDPSTITTSTASDGLVKITLKFCFLRTSQNGLLSAELGQQTQQCLFNLHGSPTEFPMFPSLYGGLDYRSQRCFSGIRSYMRQCDKQHNVESSTCVNLTEITLDEIPSRIIDVISDPCRLAKVESIDDNFAYAALSYCWGIEQDYVLTTATLEEKCTALDAAKIAGTISDAIYATRQLGLKYLWIDALYVYVTVSIDRVTNSNQGTPILDVSSRMTMQTRAGKFPRWVPSTSMLALP